MSDAFSLALTSKVTPPKQFTIDGEEYDLLALDHLTPDDEAEVMALFSRHSLIQQQLGMTENVPAGSALAKKLRKARVAILAKMTTVPRSKLDAYKTGLHVLLLEAVQNEIDNSETDEEEEDEAE